MTATTDLAAGANARRNRRGHEDPHRRARWRPMRDTARMLLEPHVRPGARVAVLGAGNGDTLPLRALARRAGRLILVDVDAAAARVAQRSCRPWAGAVSVSATDVTGGAADAVVAAVREDHPGSPIAVPEDPLDGAPYDVVIVDLMLSQLLYPALLDAGLERATIERALSRHGQALTDAVLARVDASAPAGTIVVLDDLLGWWDGQPQPVALDAILAAAVRDLDAALALAARGRAPRGCDPHVALARLDRTVETVALWRWPFAQGTDYLVRATVAPPR